ncbi:MAG: HRDC domain-containing protein [Deltaproteobacteria bacterium]|nr:HRDC domain-containing protein [Deltaproteobacteria bacterium]
MKIAVFNIPVYDAEPAQNEVNKFLASHRVTSIDKEFVNNGVESFWTVCLEYLDGATASFTVRKGKLDYREVLNEKEFSTFAKLRNLRKTLAEQEGLPAYALFTNEQLAAMVQHRVTTKAELSEISGVGEARVSKYGDAFLTILSTDIRLLDSFGIKEDSVETRSDRA